MEFRFDYLSKLVSSIDSNEHETLSKGAGKVKDFNEVNLFDENGTFNKNLLNKEEFINSLFDKTSNNEEDKLSKEQLEKLYDKIASMDGNEEMSEEELKFFASLGLNDKQDTIDKSDITAIIGDSSESSLASIGEIIQSTPEEMAKVIQNIDDSEDSTDKACNSPDDDEVSSKIYTERVHEKVTEMTPITSVNRELDINGEIDKPVIQSRKTGSCWLLSGIDTLNSTEKGKQIIRNSIIPNEDGTITVNFAGANRKITITPDEIKAHDTDNNLIDEYSNGDNDMLVLELATEKLKNERPDMFENPQGGINGGYSEELWKALTPNYDIETFAGKNIQSQVHDTLKKALNNKNLAVVFP